MLRELHISNLAIIEKVDIELTAGLNVFTGQTGAGKSLILGALELLLGLRGGGEDAATFVRPGSQEARVSGLFEVFSPSMAGRLAEILDQPIATAEPILITRRVLASGRSSVSVNGSPVTAGMLRDAGQYLVDIHGQHDQQFLLKPANQLFILDAFADASDTRRQFSDTIRQLRAAQQRLAELRASQEQRAEQLELYLFQIEEIDRAALAPGQYEQAKNRYNVLKNVAHLKGQSANILGVLSDGDDTVLDRMGSLGHLLAELAKLDASLADVSGLMEQARSQLQEAAWSLSRYQDRLDVDPAELGQVEERLNVLNHLIHKYGRSALPTDDPVEAVLAHRRKIGDKAQELQSDSTTLADLDKNIADLHRQLGEVGKQLTRLRAGAGKKLKTLIEGQFHELEMPEATFDVQIVTLGADDASVDSSGLDQMEFMVRTNPGQDRLPLRKIASGGEISRIMLALKTILADKDQITVLVFDEIDANIGDRLGATIGRKMRALAHGVGTGLKPVPRGAAGLKPVPQGDGSAHQIICITHLSQIAACADHHLQISKDIVGPGKDRQTVASVRVLSGEDRVLELAEMMAGKKPTAATIAHARELLTQAKMD